MRACHVSSHWRGPAVLHELFYYTVDLTLDTASDNKFSELFKSLGRWVVDLDRASRYEQPLRIRLDLQQGHPGDWGTTPPPQLLVRVGQVLNDIGDLMNLVKHLALHVPSGYKGLIYDWLTAVPAPQLRSFALGLDSSSFDWPAEAFALSAPLLRTVKLFETSPPTVPPLAFERVSDVTIVVGAKACTPDRLSLVLSRSFPKAQHLTVWLERIPLEWELWPAVNIDSVSVRVGNDTKFADWELDRILERIEQEALRVMDLSLDRHMVTDFEKWLRPLDGLLAVTVERRDTLRPGLPPRKPSQRLGSIKPVAPGRNLDVVLTFVSVSKKERVLRFDDHASMPSLKAFGASSSLAERLARMDIEYQQLAQFLSSSPDIRRLARLDVRLDDQYGQCERFWPGIIIPYSNNYGDYKWAQIPCPALAVVRLYSIRGMHDPANRSIVQPSALRKFAEDLDLVSLSKSRQPELRLSGIGLARAGLDNGRSAQETLAGFRSVDGDLGVRGLMPPGITSSSFSQWRSPPKRPQDSKWNPFPDTWE